MKTRIIKLFSLFLLLLFILPTVRAQGEEIERCKQFINNPPAGSIYVKNIVSEELSNRVEPEVISELTSPPTLNKAYTSLNKAVTTYKDQQKSNAIASKVLRANNEIVKYSLSFVSSIGSGPLAPFIAKVMHDVVDKSLDGVANEFDRLNQESAKNVFSNAISNYREGEGNLDKLVGMKPAAILNELNQNGYLPALDLKDKELDADGRSIAQEAMIKDLAKMDKAILTDLADKGKQIKNIQEEVKDLRASSQKLWEVTKEVDRRVSRIESNMNDIKTSLSNMNKEISKNKDNILDNRKDIEYLQSFMFGKMSPKERIEALNNGFFEGMDAVERQKLEDKLILEAKRNEVISDMSYYVNSAGELLNIAGNLGFEGKFMNDAGNAIQAGQHIINGITAMNSPGGWLSAASSFSNVLGMGRKKVDVAGERHRQITGMLKQVLANQKQMMDKLKTIEANQQKMLENQLEIYTSIIKLSQQVQNNYDGLMRKLENVNTNILVNRAGIETLQKDGYHHCYNILKAELAKGDNSSKLDSLINFPSTNLSILSFDSYDEKIAHYDNISNDIIKPFPKCMEYLDKAVSLFATEETHTRFSADYHVLNKSDQVFKRHESFIENYWKQQYTTLNNVMVDYDLNFPQVFMALSNPVSKSSVLDLAYVDHLDSYQFPKRLSNRVEKIENIQVFYSYEVTRSFSKVFIEFLPYFELINPQNKDELFSIAELMENKTDHDLLKGRIMDAIARLDILITQQSLLAGTTMIPYYYKTYNSVDSDKVTTKNNLVYLLSRNDQLAYNFVLYGLQKELEKSKQNTLYYHFAINAVEGDDHYLRKILDENSPWKLVYKNDEWLKKNNYPLAVNWCIEFSDDFTKNNKANVIIPLPTVSGLQSGLLQYSDELYGALQLRASLIEHLESFDFLESLPEVQRAIIAKSMLTNN